jgi:flagellar motor switch/type III secretory pathway protein FliN
MIAELAFPPIGTMRGRKTVRRAVFVSRAAVPLARAFAFGRLVQERLPRLFGRDVAVRIGDPAPVAPEHSALLYQSSSIFAVDGDDASLRLVIADGDARRIAAAAFGEDDPGDERPVSPFETRVVERLAGEVGSLAYPLCGRIDAVRRIIAEPAEHPCASWFEFRLDFGAKGARIGIALTSELTPTIDRHLTPAALDALPLTCEARFARGTLTARALAALQVGSVVRFETRLHEPAELVVGRTTIARGACGTRRGLSAFTVTEAGGARALADR